MLNPRNTVSQNCISSNIIVSPIPDVLDNHIDFFGNKAFYFLIGQEHESLSVTVNSLIEKLSPPTIATSDMCWEAVRNMLQFSAGNFIEERQFMAATDITAPSKAIAEFAATSFTPGKPLFKAVYHLMGRIYSDFIFTPGFTTISTPLSTVMLERKGVCQDFAHLGIACLHAMGLPARYVSGYIETLPPEGEEKLSGVDASHAWFSVFIPGMGWTDFDPTNNKIPDGQYITVGWGRNYFDIVPLKGVIMSSNTHEMKVSVDVRRVR